MGPAMFCLVLRPELKRFRHEFDIVDLEVFAYMGDVSLGFMGGTADTGKTFALVQ